MHSNCERAPFGSSARCFVGCKYFVCMRAAPHRFLSPDGGWYNHFGGQKAACAGFGRLWPRDLVPQDCKAKGKSATIC